MTTGRMRAFVGLTVAGAVLLMTGVLMMLIGEAMRLHSPHGWQGIIGLGERAAVSGLGCGLVLMVIVATVRPSRSRTPARAAGRPDRSGRSARHTQAERGWDDGREDTDWRHATAEQWLSPLRSSTVRLTPEAPDRAPQQPLPEFSPVLDYSDDGWLPGGQVAGYSEYQPAQPPRGLGMVATAPAMRWARRRDTRQGRPALTPRSRGLPMPRARRPPSE
jgi:hypothetical protein